MQLSKFTDYAFRSLIYLAKNREENININILAEKMNISIDHLKKIINKLAKTDYITTIKGRNGGLKLGVEPKDINLGDILKITEENMSIVECMKSGGNCPFIVGDCKLKKVISNSLNSFIEEMSKYTLEDIL